jgi:hypothetical protein
MTTRWPSWRRDLLFALAGAVVAAGVLVPVGWSRVRAERQRAEAAEEEAAKQRAVVEDRDRIAREEVERAVAEQEKAKRIADEEYRRIEAEYREAVQPRFGSFPPAVTLDELARERAKILEAERPK